MELIIFHKIFIKLELPSIFSSNQRQFKWIKYLGYNILEDVSLIIDFKDKFNKYKSIPLYTYTEWLYIWNEINLSDEEKKYIMNL